MRAEPSKMNMVSCIAVAYLHRVALAGSIPPQPKRRAASHIHDFVAARILDLASPSCSRKRTWPPNCRANICTSKTVRVQILALASRGRSSKRCEEFHLHSVVAGALPSIVFTKWQVSLIGTLNLLLFPGTIWNGPVGILVSSLWDSGVRFRVPGSGFRVLGS